jgi:hypothetical protein
MTLNENELGVVKAVVHQFLSEKRPSARKPLLLLAGSRDVLDKLARWSILKTSDHQTYLPTALAFHYSGDADALLLARHSIQILAGVLKSTYELEVDDRQFTPEEIETLARMKYKDDPSRVVDLEGIKLGLYLANEFSLLSAYSTNQAQTEVAFLRISDYVVEIKEPETLWDEQLRRRIEWVEGQAAGPPSVSTNQPGFDLQSGEPLMAIDDSRQISQRVFVVHGHDDGIKETVARFLEKLGLEAIVLHERPSKGRTVIEKVEANSEVGFAVVILTPDDVGASKKLRKRLKDRARQNVILELGYFLGKLGRERVCALHVKEVELPSDFHGVVYVSYDKAGAWRTKLMKEIIAAGMNVDSENSL